MHRLVLVWIRRLSAPVLRRALALVLGAVGVLALSGSQVWNPAVAASGSPDAESGSLTLVSPTGSLPYPTSSLGGGLPTGTVAPSTGTGTGPYGVTSPSALTSSGIPEPAYRAYVAAAAELARTDPSCGVSWTVIAGIGRVESNHGRYGGSTINADGLVTPPILGIRLDGSKAGTARISDSDNGQYDGDTAFDRAVGPMQFLPGTWKAYGGGANPQNMNAAALGTARYLCAGSGSMTTQKGRWAAVFRYNHSDSYVSLVLSLADSYAKGQDVPFQTAPGGSTPSPTDGPATNPGPPPAVSTPTPTPTTTKPTPKPTGKPKPNPKPTIWPTATVPPTTAQPTTAPTTSSPAGTPTPTDPCDVPDPGPTASPTPTVTPTPKCPTVESTPTPTAKP
ncbi:MAG TPA: lytic transglycosylase domain-containing protein [Kineosporiaceae bacterium]|nr:lytic transglycosylase domain-containing protein [Kineosporiaceae bacterium]